MFKRPFRRAPLPLCALIGLVALISAGSASAQPAKAVSPTAAPAEANPAEAPAVPAAAAESAGAATESMTAREILDRVDDLYRGAASQGTMSMKVVTEHWTREMKMEVWSKGKERSLVRILAPRKEKGTATLKSGNNIWNYLPKVRRVIKVPSSMMGGSWMGSHFTNDDLVKESRMADDFVFEKAPAAAEREGGGEASTEIRCTPKPDAAVVWGRVDVLVRDADTMPLRIRYYDEDLELARTLTFSEYKDLGGRRVPTLMRMQPADKPGESTEVRYHELRFDVELSDGLFTLRSLQR